MPHDSVNAAESIINQLGIVWHSQEQCERAKEIIATALAHERQAGKAERVQKEYCPKCICFYCEQSRSAKPE